MSSPDSSPADTVAGWHAQLLLQIRMLEAEHTRVRDVGYETSDDPDLNDERRSAYLAHLDTLEAAREHAEQTALSAGVEPTWIEDIRELGIRDVHPPVRAAARRAPARENAAQEMYVDMLGLDLWHLERMASLVTARADRIDTGRWSFGTNPIAEQRFAHNMALRHQRVTALAHAADLTAVEAEALWGTSAEGARRGHAVFVETYDELKLAAEWTSYATASPELAIPPYLPEVATATPGVGVTPPTPQQMINAAGASLHAHLVDAAVRDPGEFDPVEGTAITTAIDAALPEGGEAALPDGAAWADEPDHVIEPHEPQPATELDTEI
ncbi:hypothetical protein [Nocardia lijiangensis]|uniref:hypothetical protein n=1 Tax=Nocardia lijiangensis TaxID=299618 RepID=UPI0008303250|nr:hypothetical protein [Nocardia lijiangensis]